MADALQVLRLYGEHERGRFRCGAVESGRAQHLEFKEENSDEFREYLIRICEARYPQPKPKPKPWCRGGHETGGDRLILMRISNHHEY